jgi:hypothetical protein
MFFKVIVNKSLVVVRREETDHTAGYHVANVEL